MTFQPRQVLPSASLQSLQDALDALSAALPSMTSISEVNAAIAAALVPYSTTVAMEAAIDAAISAAIADLVDTSPTTLDTLNELAAALGDDANFATTMTNALALKAPLASPALTGTPTAPTASPGTNTTQIATTAFVAAGFQPADAELTALAALTTTAFGRALLETANAAALRTAAELASGNSPQFAAINVGHASDSPITRVSAGILAIAGVNIATNSLALPHTASGYHVGHASDTEVTRAQAGVIAVAGLPIYSGIPQNSQSAAYTTVLADAQKHLLHPAADNNARTFTIAANASVAYPVGTCLTFVNEVNTVTIAINSDTLVLAGTGATGSRTLAANGVATALKITSTKWIISGVGLT